MLKPLIALSMLFVVATPALAEDRERTAPPDATLYEVTEAVRFEPASSTVVFRAATATLMGRVQVGTVLCRRPLAPGAESCTVIGLGSDKIPVPAVATNSPTLDLGKSIVAGTIAVVVNAPGNSSVHVPDFPILTGRFFGEVNLSQAILAGIPLGSLTKAFILLDDPLNQNVLDPIAIPIGLPDQPPTGAIPLRGTFRLPFAIDANGDMKPPSDDEDAFYLGDDGQLIEVQPQERSLGFPTVRLEIHFGSTQ